jgi:hypothetical protein
MNQEKLNVIIEFNKTNKMKECPILLDRISWGYLTDNILYGSFHHPQFKYLNIKISNEYRYKRNWTVIKCEPNIYKKTESNEFISLNEYNLDDYFSHEDYWCAELYFEQPKDCLIYAKEAVCLKWQHDFIAVYFPSNNSSNISLFHKLLHNMKKPINIGYIYDKKNNEVELIQDEYSEVVGEILNDLKEI